MALITVPPIRGYTARWRILDHPPGYKNPEEFLLYPEVGKPEQPLINGLLHSTPISTAHEDETTRCPVRLLYFKRCRSSVLCEAFIISDDYSSVLCISYRVTWIGQVSYDHQRFSLRLDLLKHPIILPLVFESDVT